MENSMEYQLTYSSGLLKEDQKNKSKKPCQRIANTGRKHLFVIFVVLTVFIFVAGILTGYFSKKRTSCVKDIEQSDYKDYKNILRMMINNIKSAEIQKTVRTFASQPHYPGSQREKELAKKIKEKWQSYGFDVDITEYEVLLTIPDEKNPDYIELVDESGKRILKETFVTKAKAVPHDNKTWNIPHYFFYSPSRYVSGGLLYVNEGRKEDFQHLATLNISACNGSIVILKQTKFGHIVEQMKNAYECHAEGVVLFLDKNRSFPTRNDTYPNGVWLPEEIPTLHPLVNENGDILTPGLPALPGIYRINKNDLEQLPKLPVQLVNYTTAITLLKYLKGERIPKSWKPSSDKTGDYHVGPDFNDNWILHLAVNSQTKMKKIQNVIGTVQGKEEMDHWVLIGNHRDSIAFGGVDAVSGMATMMETSRSVGELLRQGWTPRRTIKFCSWGAEEPGLIGSTEWVEDNIKLLQERGVAYINMDVLVYGNSSLKSNGDPMLTDLIFSQTKLVQDPVSPGKTIYSTWRRKRPSKDSSLPSFFTSGGSTDYQPFYEMAGVACLDLQYTSQDIQRLYQAYHTVYDTYHWVKFIDPDFNIHMAQTKLVSRLLFSLAHSPLLPLNLTYLSRTLTEILQRTNVYYGETLRKHNITLHYLSEETEKLRETIQEFEGLKQKVEKEGGQEQTIQMLNRRMVSINKMFLAYQGVPNRPWVKNILYGISNNRKYPNISLVAISDSILEARNNRSSWDSVKHQVSITQHCIKQARDSLKLAPIRN